MSEWAVGEEEFPVHVRGQPSNSSFVAEFHEHMELSRRWVLAEEQEVYEVPDSSSSSSEEE